MNARIRINDSTRPCVDEIPVLRCCPFVLLRWALHDQLEYTVFPTGIADGRAAVGQFYLRNARLPPIP